MTEGLAVVVVCLALAGGWAEVSPLGRQSSVKLPSGVRGTEAGLSVKAIAAGGGHSLALASDGTVWQWGGNYEVQLDWGTTPRPPIPAQVNGLRNVVAIAAGYRYSLALRGDGTVWAWGENDYGQLGDGTTTDRRAPVQVEGLRDVVAVAATGYVSVFSGLGPASLAVQRDGTVWMWGWDARTPMQVIPPPGQSVSAVPITLFVDGIRSQPGVTLEAQ